MLASLVPSLVGFVLIFVAFRDSGNPNGLITLGVSGVQVSVGGCSLCRIYRHGLWLLLSFPVIMCTGTEPSWDCSYGIWSDCHCPATHQRKSCMTLHRFACTYMYVFKWYNVTTQFGVCMRLYGNLCNLACDRHGQMKMHTVQQWTACGTTAHAISILCTAHFLILPPCMGTQMCTCSFYVFLIPPCIQTCSQ